MNVLDVAIDYCRRGWSVIPVPHRSKNPGYLKWEQTRLKEVDLAVRFNGSAQNIGVLLGEPSGWLIDIDLDHPTCISLADKFLPPTSAVFGRLGKPRSHRLYKVTAPVATKRHRSRSAGMLVELRSTGLQTIFPPSTHESGEAIEWETEGIEPALVAPELLLRAVEQLARTVRINLGEMAPPNTPKKSNRRGTVRPSQIGSVFGQDKQGACLEAMLRIRQTDNNDGSARLFAAACRVVEHDLSDEEGLAVIREFGRHYPFPTDWTDSQILARIRDAENKVTRGSALRVNISTEKPTSGADATEYRVGAIDSGALSPTDIAKDEPPPGTIDSDTGRLVLSTDRTLPTAEAFIEQFHRHSDGVTLRHYAGLLMEWRGNRYVEIDDDAMRNRLLPWLHAAVRVVQMGRDSGWQLRDFPANPNTVNRALESIKSQAYLPVATAIPHWLDNDAARPNPCQIVACKSSLLFLPTMSVLPPTPAFFNVNALDYEYDPNAAEPKLWLSFLGQLFCDDHESWDLLQEWFGYCLTGDTSQQKMLIVVGPRRSGKGTIARALARLVGVSNVCGPTTSSLAGPFGLQPLIGKSLAIVSDARFSGRDVQTVIERLLCISGEDALTVDRKHKVSVTMKLPTRFLFLTNELPRLTDASGALAGRFMMLRLTETFYSREDIGLTEKLLTELPGVLNWAIRGRHQLNQRGYFVQPSRVEDALRDMEDLSSPVGAFVRERCDVDAAKRVWIDDLYASWKEWCEADGRISVTTKQTFGRDLMAAVPGIVTRQGTNGARFYDGIGLRGAVQ